MAKQIIRTLAIHSSISRRYKYQTLAGTDAAFWSTVKDPATGLFHEPQAEETLSDVEAETGEEYKLARLSSLIVPTFRLPHTLTHVQIRAYHKQPYFPPWIERTVC